MKRRIKVGVALLATAGVALVAVSSVAVPRNGDCVPIASARLSVTPTGTATLREPVVFSAQGSLLLLQQLERRPPGRYSTPPECLTTSQPLSDGTFELRSVPAGSQAKLAATGTLRQTLTPDRAGDYVVRFTACPTGCGHRAAPDVAEVTLHVDGAFRPRPDTEPMVYTEPSPHPSSPYWPYAAAICANSGGGAAVTRTGPEWAAMSYWPNGGPPPYVTVEGLVTKASVARVDMFTSHDSQDVSAVLSLDPDFRRFRKGNQEELEIEWENPRWPDSFRAVPGDRVSAIGYHVLDCAHDPPDYHSEIHPPIATAVHRPRALLLPSTAPVFQAGAQGLVQQPIGTNVWIAGIATDVWVDRASSGSLCGGGACMVNRQGSLTDDYVTGPSPVAGVTFTFKVRLPASPSEVAKRQGYAPPAIGAPLYARFVPPVGAPTDAVHLQPRFTGNRRLDGPEPFVEVAVDLGALGDRMTGAARIEAGWVYPDVSRDGARQENWGLMSYRVQLSELKVIDDGDPWPTDHGDWRYWMLFPRANRPWVRLIDFDCAGCVEEKTYSGTSGPWARGAFNPDGTVASDQIAFPWQTIAYQTTGFEDDTWSSDGVESISASHATSELYVLDRGDGTGCKPVSIFDGWSGCTSYTAVTRFVPGGQVIGASNMDPQVKRMAMGFWYGAPPRPGSDAVAPTPPFKLIARARPPATPPNPAVSAAAMTAAHAQHPGRVDFALRRMNARLKKSLAEARTPAEKSKILRELAKLKPHIPADLYKKHLCEVEAGHPCR